MRRGRGAVRPAALLSSFLSLLLSCLSCAGAPAAPAAPAASSQPGSGPGAAAGGTALKGAAPQALSRALEERRAVEAAVVFGSPSSIAKAFSLIAEARSLKEDEARSLAWMGARIALLVYPESADSFVPADLRGQAELPASPLARSLADAAAGRVPALLPEAEGTPLGELVPALAAFRSDSRETARRCLEALDRFERLGAPSVLPGLVRGLDAERRKDFARALDYYAGVRSAAPDAWPASLGAARAYLALGRPAAAEELLRQVDPAAADSPPIRRVRARALYDLGRLSEAEPLVLRILLEDPQDSAFVLVRAHLLARSRSFQQAQPLLDAYGTVDPSNRRYLVLRAEVAEGLRGRDEALKWARRGLAAYPDDPELLAVAARLLFAVPSSLRADLVEAARSEGRELARRAEGQAAPGPAAAPAGSPGAPSGAAPAAASAGAAALSPLEESLRAAARAEAARLLLLDAAASYDWTLAASYLPRAKAAPGFEDRALSGLVRRKSGDWAGALEEAAAWYKEKPESEAAAEAYARALLGTKAEKAASDLAARLLAGKGSPAFRSSLFWLQAQLAKSDDAALSALRSALVENPDNSEALAAMCDIYLRRRDFQKARFYLKQALALSPGDPELKRRSRELEASAP